VVSNYLAGFYKTGYTVEENMRGNIVLWKQLNNGRHDLVSREEGIQLVMF